MFKKMKRYWRIYVAYSRHRARMRRLDRSERIAEREHQDKMKGKKRSWWRETLIGLAIIVTLGFFIWRFPEYCFRVLIVKLRHDLWEGFEISWFEAISEVWQAVFEQFLDIAYGDTEIEDIFDEDI